MGISKTRATISGGLTVDISLPIAAKNDTANG